jgi:putative transcriptional regulator
MTKRKFRSEIARTVHEGVRGMRRLGLADKKTMREFDLRCLTAIEDMAASDIHALRQREGVSQAVFARCLNLRAKGLEAIL